MEVPTRLAVVMSGLVFVGGAVLTGISAGAEAAVTTAQLMPSGHKGRHHSSRQSSKQRGDQRTLIVNRIINIARIDSDQGQVQRLRGNQRLRNHQGDTSAKANAEAAAGGNGGGGAGSSAGHGPGHGPGHGGGNGAATSHTAAGGGGASGGGGAAATEKSAAGGGGGGGGGDTIYNPNQIYSPLYALRG